jgi:hypothetical protein
MPAYNAIINALELNPSIVIDLAEEFEISRRSVRLHPEKWSALEHIAHLARVEAMLHERLKRMLAEPDCPIVPYDPQHDDPRTLKDADWDESLSRYQWDRAEVVGILRGVDPPTWERRYEHPEYAVYSIRHLARHWALHDLAHAYRIEEILLTHRPA